MRRFYIILLLVFPCLVLAQSAKIDRIIRAELQAKGLELAEQSSDEVFVRRVYIDLTGTLPAEWQVRTFLKSEQPNKRRQLIKSLMKEDVFADYWTMKWCDLLRVKAEFPINMWPNGVQAYARWIHDAVANNMPYDKFARQLLTSSGSNFRVPAVNFYQGLQGRKPSSIASAVGLTFMGARLEGWPDEKREGMEAFFSRVTYKGTAEWKEVIVCADQSPTNTFTAAFPDGKSVKITADDDPRELFADWLIHPDNEWFARNIVNRTWSWFFGRGLIHEADDIRADNPAMYPEVLAFLEKELVSSGYDLEHIFFLILNSETYQQSSVPKNIDSSADELFAHYPVRRLDAEVLLDALCILAGRREEHMSMVPEPFTFIPNKTRAVELTDGTITSQFLKMFGRPARDTGLESERSNAPSEGQRLHMLNSTHVQTMIDNGWRLKNIDKVSRKKPGQALDMMFLSVLSRFPTEEERKRAMSSGKNNSNARKDLFWAMVNSKEFLYRH